jgi:hypothetical protein
VVLMLDLLLTHDRWGSSTDPNLNDNLHYPNDKNRSLNETVTDVVRLGGYIVILSDFNSYRLMGKLAVFFATSGVQLV